MNLKYLISILFHAFLALWFYIIINLVTTDFQVIVIAGLAIIYSSLISGLALSSWLYADSQTRSSKRFLYSLKFKNAPSLEEDIADFESIIREDNKKVDELLVLYFIKSTFSTIIFLGAIIYVLKLDSSVVFIKQAIENLS